MKCSIITPTNIRNSFLEELYQSILSQTYDNWEWVIYLNGGASEIDVPFSIKLDPKVKIYTAKQESENIGFIKNKAFHLGEGDCLIEVDHDDMLVPSCLEKVVAAFEDPEVGFVYSNNAIYDHNNDFQPYNPDLGWEYSKFQWKDRELYEMHTFPPTSHSIAYIWYAPDHVRAWRTSLYRQMGGHNTTMYVCDDHELMIRTFLKTKMFHIPEALYIYRITGENNWCKRNEEIQKMTLELADRYVYHLAAKDAKNKGLKIIDLNSRGDAGTQCERLDIKDENIPLDDNTVGVMILNHSLQLFKDPLKIMSEIHRVLCHGGWLFIDVPSTDGRGAWQDPTHVSFWNENSFSYYTDSNFSKFLKDSTIRFMQNRNETERFKDYIAVTKVRLIALKDGPRFPGNILI